MGKTTMRRLTTAAALAALMGASGCALSEILAGDDGRKTEPLYCYQALVGVDCYKTPNHRDERRLLSYTGPAPETYAKPPPQPEPQLFAPEMVNYYVKDLEPVPTSPPKMRAVSRESLPPARPGTPAPKPGTQKAK